MSTRPLYLVFYKNYGLRRVQDLLSPRVLPFDGFPKDSILQHVTFTDNEQIDVDTSKSYFRGYDKPIFIEFPVTNVGTRGNPVTLNFIPREHFREFIRTHRKFRYTPDVLVSPDILQLLVVNHDYQKQAYRYQETLYTNMNIWYNRMESMLTHMVRQMERSTRNHFLILDAPTQIPGRDILLNMHDKPDATKVRVFNTPDRLLVLNLFQFIYSDLRKESVFNIIPKKHYHKLTLSFRLKDGRFSHLNLAYLYSWLKGNENLTPMKGLNPDEDVLLFKKFLKFLLILGTPLPESVVYDEVAEEALPASEGVEEDDEDQTDDDEGAVSENKELVSELGTASRNKQADTVLSLQEKKDPNIEATEKMVASLSDDILMKQMAELDEDLAILDRLERERLANSNAQQSSTPKNADLSTDEPVNEPDPIVDVKVNIEELRKEVLSAPAPDDKFRADIEARKNKGILNAIEYKKALKDHESYLNSKSPFDNKTPIKEASVVKPEDLAFKQTSVKIPPKPTVFDEDMLESTLMSYTRDYVKKVMPKDKLAVVRSVQNGRVGIRKHEMEVVHTVDGAFERHRIELKPLDGVVSPLWFKFPVVKEDGSFEVSGSKYILRKQRVDVPIRLIAPNTVALTTNYGKTFINTGVRKANSSAEWLWKNIDAAQIEGSTHIKKVIPGDMYDNYSKAPYVFNILSQRYRRILLENITLVFEHGAFDKWKDEPNYKKVVSAGGAFIGFSAKNEPIYVDKNDQFFLLTGGTTAPLGDIYDILKLDMQKAPLDYSEVSIFSKPVPVAAVLGYRMGLAKLIKLLDVTPRVVDGRKQKNLEPHEYAISFSDKSYIFSRKDRLASMILSGLTAYEKSLKNYEAADFNYPDVYMNLLTTKGLGVIHAREMGMMLDYFVDPISRDTLQDMGEPVTFEGLLIRGSEMLLTYTHPSSQDTEYQLVRGYERFSAILYKELMVSIRSYRNRNIYGKSKIEMSPYKVWQTILQDASVKLVEDINPVQNLKEDEIVTFVGEGGRSKGAINKASRSWNVNDDGLISEATVDSGDVGVNTYLTANPRFKNMRGRLDKSKRTSITSKFSSSAALAPFVLRDSPQRMNFVSIMNSHVVPTAGMHVPYIRTGFESVVADRTSPMFAYTAKKDGVVISLNEHGVIIEYEDGERVGLPLGRHYGRAEGSIYPHDLVAMVKEGEKFNVGKPITYNTNFFQEDFLAPGTLVMKFANTALMAFVENKATFEDSSTVSKAYAAKLLTRSTKERVFTVEFRQNLHEVAKPGMKVTPTTSLMIIEDAITSDLAIFSKDSAETLKALQKKAPKANYLGILDRIEVKYHGDKNDMSESLRKLADQSDRFFAARAKAKGEPPVTGFADEGHRVDGVPLGVDKAEIKFFITVETSFGVGDKSIVANQMKSVTGQTTDFNYVTEDGRQIDKTFSFRALSARAVLSPTDIAAHTTAMVLIQEEFIKTFEES